MAASETDIAVQLIERLLADPAFRDRFRRNPALACREAGLESLADEMALGAGKAMYTLDIRESRSSLAGVMMAAAMEGMGVYEFSQHVVPHLEDLSGAVGDVLSRVNLPALPGAGALAGSPKASAAALVPDGGGGAGGPDVADAGGGGAAAGNGAAPAEPAGGGGTPGAPASPEAGDRSGVPASPEAAAAGAPAAPEQAAAGAKAGSPESPEARAAEGDAKAGGARADGGKAPDLPSGSSLPDGSGTPASSDGAAVAPASPEAAAAGAPASPEAAAAGAPASPEAAAAGAPASPEAAAAGAPASPEEAAAGAPASPEAAAAGGKPGAPAAGDAPEQPGGSALPDGEVKPRASEGGPAPGPDGKAAADPQAATAAPVPEPHASSAPVDPSQFGQDGTGGAPDAEALALLKNKNVVLDQDAIADIREGRIDPRVVGVLTKLSHEHEIVVSCMCRDHPRFTTGGSVSNHNFGRGADIASIDGEIVGPGSPLAREVASQLSQLDSDIRPNEIGSPFAIAGPGYFTDAAHQNHIHIGFKQAITPDFKLPADVAATAPAAAAPAAAPVPAVAAAAPAVAAPAAVAPDPKRASGLFAAVHDQAKASAAAAGDGPKPGHDSNLFLQAVEKDRQAKAAAAGAPPATPAAASVDAAPAPAAAVDLGTVGDTYPGDDAPKPQLAAWMAKQAEKRGLPAQLPVMASLVESGLKNLNFGDADSVGYFQMRVGIWNQGAYAGYPDKPELQLKWFLDNAETVKKQRLAAGSSITDPNQFGEWIADIERPAEQFRGRYQLRLGEANGLLDQAPKTPTPEPAAPAAPPVEPQRVVTDKEPIDPSQFGQDGTGGAPDAEALALLKNKNVVLDQDAIADIREGRIDPRVVGVLTKLSHEHEIVVSCMCRDHPRFTTGGSVSNHNFGRGADIASIDGEIVGPGSPLAREVASQLSQLDSDIRPNEIGSPFAIAGPGYFTDAAHQNHIHIGFKQAITPDFKLPADVAATAPAAAAPAAAPVPAVAAAAPAVAAPAAVAPDPKRASGLFAAVHDQAKASAAAAGDGPKPGHDSNLFLQAVEKDRQAKAAAAGAPPATPAAASVDAAPAPAAAVDLGTVGDTYPGDDAPKPQLAAWMAKQAEKRGLPAQLPVMASLVESGLKNLNFGDADSVGYFQMRVGIWNQGAYAGYPDKPELQLKWFLDNAETVKKQRLAAGSSITDPNQFGEWIADIERPAEQFRGRYQLRLGEANGLLDQAPKTPTPEPAAPAAPAAGVIVEAAPPAMARGAAPKALAALTEAKKFTGTPYKWGGSTPQTGFDCSGLVQWAYAQAGVKIPRVTDQQFIAANGSPVRRAELLPGDLVFFRDPTGYIHHVGISLGGDRFLHAPHTGDVVKESSLNEPYYKEQFAGGRRFAETSAAAPPAAAPAAVAPAPAVDPVEVAAAQAAVARDAAEVRQLNSNLFKAINAQEARNHKVAGERALAGIARASGADAPGAARNSGLFLKAVDAAQAERAKAASFPAVPPPAPPVDPAAPPAPAPAAPAVPDPAAAAAPVGPPPELGDVPADYPGDDAGQPALAKWLAKQAEKAGLPPELPVMASLVESGVRNINYGDADSVGFFQMRVGIWNQGDYAGYPHKPGLQAKWFIDHALAVKKQRIAAGDAGFGKDPSKWGEWIADIERPAAQYRGRYQLRLDEARRLLK